jgi:hypothetical protein
MALNEVSFSDILTRGTYGFFIFALLILLFILVISWGVLPIFIFKIKAMLIDTNIQLIRMNRYLMSIEELLKEQIEFSCSEKNTTIKNDLVSDMVDTEEEESSSEEQQKEDDLE